MLTNFEFRNHFQMIQGSDSVIDRMNNKWDMEWITILNIYYLFDMSNEQSILLDSRLCWINCTILCSLESWITWMIVFLKYDSKIVYFCLLLSAFVTIVQSEKRPVLNHIMTFEFSITQNSKTTHSFPHSNRTWSTEFYYAWPSFFVLLFLIVYQSNLWLVLN